MFAGLTPKELHLHLDVAVYYFFMQLYALFPCNLSQFLRAHYAHSSQEEVAKMQEYILVRGKGIAKGGGGGAGERRERERERERERGSKQAAHTSSAGTCSVYQQKWKF